MSRKEYLTDTISFIKSYDRYLLSDTIFSDPKAYEIASFLVQALPKGQSYITGKSITAIEKPGNQAGKNALNLLIQNGIIKGKLSASFEEATRKAVSSALTQGISHKILLITQNENEGYEYEKLDYEDNHLNDIDAIGFDSNVKGIKYVYEAPKEEFVFKFVFPGPSVSSLKIIFHKTTGLAKQIVSDPNNPTSECRSHEERGYHLFVYKTFKDVLFEADKFELIGQVNGQVVKSVLHDFYIGQEQRWVISIGADNKLACTFYIPTGRAIPKTEPEPESSPKDESLGDSSTTYSAHLYSRDPVPANEKGTDAFFGRTVNSTGDQAISIAEMPKEGDTIYYSNKKAIKIIAKLGDGGEGIVYSTSDKNVVVKIYHKNKLTKLRQKKIERMAALRLGEKNPNIIWPLQSVYTANNIFVGFTMKSAGGGVDLYVLCSQRPDRKRDKIGIFDIDRTQLVELAISLVDSVSYLHKRNILIRDLKLQNLMIMPNDPTRCLLVDCDSYQIDEFVAPVHTDDYIPPEAWGVNASEKYQNLYSDVFTLFITLFRLLVTKDAIIYSTVGSEKSGLELGREGAFPFSLNRAATDAKVKGFPQAAWSHLPSYMKEAAISVADKRTGSRYEPTKRLLADEWLKLLLAYHKDLKAGPKGRLGSKDPQYNITYLYKPLQSIDYSLVQLKLISTMQGEINDFSLSRLVRQILKKSGLSLNENEIVEELRKTGKYKKDGALAILITRDVGIYVSARYAYNEV